MKVVFRWFVVGLAAVMGVSIAIVSPYRALMGGIDDLWMMSWFGFIVVGGFLVARRPDNRVSWTMAGIGLLATSAAITEEWSPTLSPTPGLIVAMLSSISVAGFVLIPLLLLWYPTGQVPSPRWAWLERLLLSLGGLLIVYYVLRPGRLGITAFDNPIGLEFLGPLRDSNLEQSPGFLIAALGAVAVGSLVVRWRRGTGQERDQIKLAVMAVVLTAVWFVICVGLVIFVGEQNRVVNAMLILGLVVGLNAFALAVAVAVVKYRLYEIDRVVARTVSYAVVVGMLALVFFGVVTAVSTFLPEGSSDLAVAASTLAVAALFNPVRRRVQGWVDRRFNRSRYDAERVMDWFASTLRDRVDPIGVVDGWVGVVSETLQPSGIGVWLRGNS